MVNTVNKPTTNLVDGESTLSVTLQQWLTDLSNNIINGQKISKEDALKLTEIEGEDNILLLCEQADRIRQVCCGNVVDLCSIVNIKSGNCSENCSFCSQSVHHQGKDSPIYGLKSQ